MPKFAFVLPGQGSQAVGMLNGFAGVTQAVTSGFSAAELARCNQQAALMQQRRTPQGVRGLKNAVRFLL